MHAGRAFEDPTHGENHRITFPPRTHDGRERQSL
jgi:hypothetical protein